MTQAFHKMWLKITALVVFGFGPIFSLGGIPELSEPARWSLDLLRWPLDGATSYASADTRFLSVITGGFLFGWGMMILALSVWVYDSAPEGVRRSVVAGLLCWFALDSLGSIASGNAANALINILVLLIAVGPLWRPARPDVA